MSIRSTGFFLETSNFRRNSQLVWFQSILREGRSGSISRYWVLAVMFLFVSPSFGIEPLNFPREVSINFYHTSETVICLDLDGDGVLEIAAGSDDGDIIFFELDFHDRFIPRGYQSFSGSVVDLQLLTDDESEHPLLVAAVSNPDQLVLYSYQNQNPDVQKEAEIDLEEDPGRLAIGPIGIGGSYGIVVPLPGCDEIVVLAEVDDQWQVTQQLTTGDHPIQAALFDLDDDGILEIITADAGNLSHSLSIFRKNIAGLYELENQPDCLGQPQYIHTYDQNDDGKDELYITYSDIPGVSIYTSDTGVLVESEYVETSMPIDGVFVAPLNEQELAMMCWNGSYEVVHYYQRSGGTWDLSSSLYSGSDITDLDACDLDGDSFLDLIMSGGASERIAVVIGNDLPGFWSYLVTFLPDVPEGGQVADINADGNLDLVAVCNSPTTLEILYGDGDGNLTAAQTIAFSNYISDLVVAHLDEDSFLDIAVLQQTLDRLVILRGTATGEFIADAPLAVGNAPFQLVVADIDGDTNSDLAVANVGEDSITLLFGNANGSFTDEVLIPFTGTINAVALIDLSADGLLEVVFSDNRPWIRVALNSDGRTFNTIYSDQVGSECRIGAVADLDGDLDLDLVVISNEANVLYLVENTGLGTLRVSGTTGPFQNMPDHIDVADINVDGSQDLLLTYTSAGMTSVYLNQDDWQLSHPINFPSTPGPIQSLVGDFNSDDVPDFVVLDTVLEIALVMLNVEANAVPIATIGLAAECLPSTVELTICPSNQVAWELEAWAGDRWCTVAANGVAMAGVLTYSNRQWQLLLAASDFGSLGLVPGADEQFLFRLYSGQTVQAPHVIRVSQNCLELIPDFALEQLTVALPQPNPFNPQVTIGFKLAVGARVTITVVDIAGRLISNLSDQVYSAGQHLVSWDGQTQQGPAGAGTYFVIIATEDQTVAQKITLLK